MSYSNNQFSLIKIYLGAFLRAPELNGFNYWSEQLTTKSIENVANTIFNLPVVQQIYPANNATYGNRDFVGSIYRNVFGKTADTEGLSYWTTKLDNGVGRGMLVLEMIDVGLSLPTTTPGQAFVANRYWAARYAIDRQVQDQGSISTANLKNEMDAVTADSVTLTPYVNNITVLSEIAAQQGTISYTSSKLHESSKNDGSIVGMILITLTGDNFKGSIGDSLGVISNLPDGLEGQVFKRSAVTAELVITGEAESHASVNTLKNLKVEFTGDDFLSGEITKISGAVRSDLQLVFYDLPAEVNGALLTAGGNVAGALLIDLTLNKLTLNGESIALSSGLISAADDVDFSGISAGTGTAQATPSVNFIGDSSANTYRASKVGDSVRAGGGNDELIGGTGSDKFIFESSALTNGLDSIENFTVGTGGDVLNVTQFTRKTLTGQAATVHLSTSTDEEAWSNGDVVVIQGYDSTGNTLDASDIQGLFGANKVLAAPTNAAKLVVITCGVEGDATVWFATNAGDPTIIEDGEIVAVATLVGVNNLEVLPFVAGNFA